MAIARRCSSLEATATEAVSGHFRQIHRSMLVNRCPGGGIQLKGKNSGLGCALTLDDVQLHALWAGLEGQPQNGRAGLAEYAAGAQNDAQGVTLPGQQLQAA